MDKEINAAPSVYDAVLIHGYWLSRSNGQYNVDGFRGSLRTRLATRAGADIYNNEGPTKLVFLGAKLKGPSYPSTSELFARETVEKYQIPQEDIITQDIGYGTEAEAVGFKRLAEENGWKRLGIVSFAEHEPSVKRFTPEVHVDDSGKYTEHRNIQEILRAYDHPRVADLAQLLAQSKYHYGFVMYELAKTIIMKVPGGKDWLYRKSEQARTEKDDSKVNDFITHAIDVFNS